MCGGVEGERSRRLNTARGFMLPHKVIVVMAQPPLDNVAALGEHAHHVRRSVPAVACLVEKGVVLDEDGGRVEEGRQRPKKAVAPCSTAVSEPSTSIFITATRPPELPQSTSESSVATGTRGRPWRSRGGHRRASRLLRPS